MKTKSLNFLKEFFFHITLASLVFILYSYGRHDRVIKLQEFIFFSNHAIGAYFIGFYLLPKYYYTQKYLHYTLYSLIVIGMVVFIEEGIMERIYFPDTKGRRMVAKIYDLFEVLPTILILLGAKFAWDAILERKKTEQLKQLAQESELQFLKTQINPHFLFNNLNNLYALAIEESPKTPNFILELSTMLRYMLYECKAKYVLLSRELEQLENFINLNKMQIEGRGTVTFTNNVTNNTTYKIAPLIFMVFIENAFKHSASSLTENINIKITIDVDDDGMLKFSCVNNYLPQSNTENLSKGIGLKNATKRLAMLYPNMHSLSVAAKNKEYNVSLNLKLN